MSVTLLCSGQGSQAAGMFNAVAHEHAAEPVFKAAEYVLGTDPRSLVSDGTDAVLARNSNAQILCVTAALANHELIREGLRRDDMVCGYSVGLVSALSIGGWLSADKALLLAQARAQAMDAAVNDAQGMVAVGGMKRRYLQSTCDDYGVHIAIANPGDRFVVGGRVEALQAFSSAQTLAGYSIKPMAVHVASHTPMMRAAAASFRAYVDGVEFSRPDDASPALCDGLNGDWVLSAAQLRDLLCAQLVHTIEWGECLTACVERGATSFLELGPGGALARMASSWRGDFPARAVEQFATWNGVVNWLTKQNSRDDAR